MKKNRPGFRINAKRPTAIAGMLAFASCIPLQIAGYSDSLNDPLIALGPVLLPVFSAAMMIAVVLLCGRTALWLSVFPVGLGVLGFAFKLIIDPRGVSLLHHVAAALLYVMIVALWALTVFYVIRTKWVLAILFLIPFFKHILTDDLPVLIGAAPTVPVSTWLKEFSMLFFMLALFFYAVSFEDSKQ